MDEDEYVTSNGGRFSVTSGPLRHCRQCNENIREHLMADGTRSWNAVRWTSIAMATMISPVAGRAAAVQASRLCEEGPNVVHRPYLIKPVGMSLEQWLDA